MFLRNSLAMAGSHLDKTAVQIGLKPERTTIVYDNEPRNKYIVEAIEKAISLGYSVCIWPSDMVHKDINDMINAGFISEQIQQLIDRHTYKDLLAKMMVTQWKKI
jgi:hypothetical protein